MVRQSRPVLCVRNPLSSSCHRDPKSAARTRTPGQEAPRVGAGAASTRGNFATSRRRSGRLIPNGWADTLTTASQRRHFAATFRHSPPVPGSRRQSIWRLLLATAVPVRSGARDAGGEWLTSGMSSGSTRRRRRARQTRRFPRRRGSRPGSSQPKQKSIRQSL
jgi:hypothetical protein